MKGQAGLGVQFDAGVVLPTGDFADQVGEQAGLATAGFGLGLDVAVDVRLMEGLAWYSTLEGSTFGVDDAFLGELAGAGVDGDVGRYWNVMALSGLRHSIPLSPPLAVHVVGQLGVGLLRAPNATFSGFGQTAELVSSWEPARGYAIGGGLTFAQRFALEAQYRALINPEISGELRSDGAVERLDGDQPVSWVRITLSVRLR